MSDSQTAVTTEPDAGGATPAAEAAQVTRVVLATRNPHKVDELRRILAESQLTVEVLDLAGAAAELGVVPEVAETGVSFVENAMLKAHAVAQATGLPAISDDSGLCVDVMGGSPGVFSARWSGAHGDDTANLELLLSQLDEVPDDKRTAWFACAAVLALPDGRERIAEGRLVGTVLRERRGSNGFGYDPIFSPDGHDNTLAELTDEAKDAISHRGRALAELVRRIPEILPQARPS
jgi:XTP/dITP diphosphohydrolase